MTDEPTEAAKAELPVCKLCGCRAHYQHDTKPIVKCYGPSCMLKNTILTERAWLKLMSGQTAKTKGSA